jgi:hypothetical protein
MNLLKDPDHEFADIEQRLRSTYAQVANEFVPERFDSSVGAGKAKQRRFGVWTPRIATLGAVAGMALAGINLAGQGPTTVIAADKAAVFKTFPRLVPTAPPGYRLGGVSRILTRQIPGFWTEYRAMPGRLPLSLVVGGISLKSMPVNYDTQIVNGRTVLITRGAEVLVEVSDRKCGSIAISGIQRTELTQTINHLRCRTFGTELGAELKNRKRSEILFTGRYPRPYATLQFHFGNVQEPRYFEVTVEPCECSRVNFRQGPTVGVRTVAGQNVLVAPEAAPDGSIIERRSLIWSPASNAMVRLDSSLDWDWTQVEAVIRGVQEVDQATFTALLETNGIKEVSLLP